MNEFYTKDGHFADEESLAHYLASLLQGEGLDAEMFVSAQQLLIGLQGGKQAAEKALLVDAEEAASPEPVDKPVYDY